MTQVTSVMTSNRGAPKGAPDAGRKWKDGREDVKYRPRRREGRKKGFRNRSIIETARKRRLPSEFGRKRTVERLRGDERLSLGARAEPNDAPLAEKRPFRFFKKGAPTRNERARLSTFGRKGRPECEKALGSFAPEKSAISMDAAILEKNMAYFRL